MAEKKEASAAAADDKQQAIEVSADKTKTVVIILIALSIVVMIATPVITIFAIKSVVASETGAAKEASKINEVHNTEVALQPAFQCNLAGTNASRYVKVDVVVQLSDADLKKYFEIRADDKPDGMLNKIRADINSIISSKRLNDLDSADGKKLLADEIKNALKELMPKDAKGTITDVFFPSIVIQ